jgi:hypothetical protein
MGEGYRFPRGGRFPRPAPDGRPVFAGPLSGRRGGGFGAGWLPWLLLVAPGSRVFNMTHSFSMAGKRADRSNVAFLVHSGESRFRGQNSADRFWPENRGGGQQGYVTEQEA